ncbi:MAG: peptidylprolyl isomerase [Deferribacteres bacterium]|nr:peptidylprolyl isomerase [candidate division KSB1 bacterium]MCB9501998.1 peptidylprolyl isomerase [Deferribacteres bacterium]
MKSFRPDIMNKLRDGSLVQSRFLWLPAKGKKMAAFSSRSRNSITSLMALVLFLLIIYSCSDFSKSPDLAKFDGGSVTQQEYVEHYLASTQYKPNEWPMEENLTSIVETKALTKITVLEAQNRKLQNDSAYIATLQKNESRVLFTRYMRDEIIASVVTDSLMNKFYAEFSPQTHMYYIMRPFVDESTEEFITSQRDTIQYVYDLLERGKPFGDLANRYSQDITSNKKGGDLGYIIPESLGDAILRSVMDTLKTNTYSSVVKGYNGFYILKKGDKRTVDVPPFAQLKDRIWQTLYRTRRHLIQKEMDKRVTKMSPRFHLVRHDDLIAHLKSKLTGTENFSLYSPVNKDTLTETELNEPLVTLDNGSINALEMFANAKKAPQNISEFDKKLQSLIEQNVLADHARELDFTSIPEIKTQLDNIQGELLRTLLYKQEVKDKINAELEDSQNLSAVEKQKIFREKERELREQLEKDLQAKYNFRFINSSFSAALEEARKQKEKQIQEKKDAGK